MHSIVDDAIHDFSVWLKTSSNPADSNRFRSHIGKVITYLYCSWSPMNLDSLVC